jgi:hypothetical protein
MCLCVWGGGGYVYSALQNFTNETTYTELLFHFNFTFFKQCHFSNLVMYSRQCS